jgi:hypothetical protein
VIVSSTLNRNANVGFVIAKSANVNEVLAVPARPPAFGVAVTCHVLGLVTPLTVRSPSS